LLKASLKKMKKSFLGVGKNILNNKIMVLIKSVWFEEDNIYVEMTDGRVVSKPVNNYPNLNRGTKNQLSDSSIEGQGRWVHWEELDEDLSAEGFLISQNSN